MEINLLDQFRDNANRFQFNGTLRDSIRFNPVQIELAIQNLKDFFTEEAFILNANNVKKDKLSFNAYENWVVYHLSQSNSSVGSILLILEISSIIYYFSSSEENKSLLQSKLKTKKGQVNINQFRDNLFELYCGIILKTGDFGEVTIDENTQHDKPLDALIIRNGKRIVVECKILNDTKTEALLMEMVTFCMDFHPALIRKYLTDQKKLNSIPQTFYWIVRDKEKLKEAKELLYSALREYQRNAFKEKAIGTNVKSVTKSGNESICSIVIEPHKIGLYEAYLGFFKDDDLGIRYQGFYRNGIKNKEFIYDFECKFQKTSIEERIIKAIKKKQEQHKSSLFDTLIIFLEYENFYGFRTPIHLQSVNIDRIKGIIHDNEIIFIIHKDSGNQGEIIRRSLIIYKSQNDLTQKLQSLNLAPFLKWN